jgi:uncharacterized Tic20 family protein
LFFVVPGAIVGILLTGLGISLVKYEIAQVTGIEMVIEYGPMAVLIGTIVALVLPFLAMIKPMI